MIRDIKDKLLRHPEFLMLLLILVVAAFFRFYRLGEYMTFLGDEGRDALVVKKILVSHDLPLLGAPTSVGNMYNGPLYYYMMSVSMAVFWLDPVAAAGMVALLGVATVGLVYYLTRVWFGKVPALVSSVLYALSPVNIFYSKSSWNPNPAPFFALLVFLGLYKAHSSKNYLWWILVGASLAFVVQMHLLALILVPVIIFMGLIEYVDNIKSRKLHTKHFWKGIVFGLLSFLFLMSPLAIFDYKYNGQNFQAFRTFFFGDRATTVNLNIFNAFGRVVPVYTHNLIERYITGPQPILIILVSVLVLVPVGYVVYQLFINKKYSWPILALSIWLLVGVLGLALYKQTVYDHYLTFLNPAPFILLGSIIYIIQTLKQTLRASKIINLLMLILVLILIVSNLQRSPLYFPPNNQLERTQKIAQTVIDETKDQPYNFALIAEHNYDAAYQFYLDMYNHAPKKLPFEKTEQLMVVCEDSICNPVGHPKQEIADFGWSQIEWEKDVEGVKVFKLVRYRKEM